MERNVKQTSESYQNALREIAKVNSINEIFVDENTSKKYLELFKELVCEETDKRLRKELEEIILNKDDSSLKNVEELFMFYKIQAKDYINPVDFVFKDDGKVTVSFDLNQISFNVCVPAKEGLKNMSFKIIQRLEIKTESISKIVGRFSYVCVHDKFHGFFVFDSNSLEKDPEI